MNQQTRSRRRPAMAGRAWVLGLLAAAAAATGDEPAPSAVMLEPVQRSGFSMQLPAWAIEVDDDLGASGRHARIEGPRRAEVSWYLHPGEDLEPFDAALEALRGGYDMQPVERRAFPDAEAPRLEALLDFGGRAWFSMTQVACPQVGVAVTISVMTPGRGETETLAARLLESFRCRSPELPRLVETWPASDLPPGFGLSLEGSPVLVHADGRWVMVARQAPATLRGMVAERERAQRVLAGYGAALGDDWSLAGPGAATRNLSGPATAWRLDSSRLGAVAASGFECAADGAAFLVFAGDDLGASDAGALAGLAARFGCPGEADVPALTERPTACEAGVADFCAAEP